MLLCAWDGCRPCCSLPAPGFGGEEAWAHVYSVLRKNPRVQSKMLETQVPRACLHAEAESWPQHSSKGPRTMPRVGTSGRVTDLSFLGAPGCQLSSPSHTLPEHRRKKRATDKGLVLSPSRFDNKHSFKSNVRARRTALVGISPGFSCSGGKTRASRPCLGAPRAHGPSAYPVLSCVALPHPLHHPVLLCTLAPSRGHCLSVPQVPGSREAWELTSHCAPHPSDQEFKLLCLSSTGTRSCVRGVCDSGQKVALNCLDTLPQHQLSDLRLVNLRYSLRAVTKCPL